MKISRGQEETSISIQHSLHDGIVPDSHFTNADTIGEAMEFIPRGASQTVLSLESQDHIICEVFREIRLAVVLFNYGRA